MIPSTLSDFRQDTETAMLGALNGTKNVALLDFPSHMNVGDGMIWAGEKAYLDALDVKIRYACDIERYSHIALRKAHPEGAILLHGGGNLGDVWPKFQTFRERVIQDFPDRKIIQLPQTLFYREKEKAVEADRIFGSHPDLTVMLRDENSMQRAKELLPSVRTVFVRDMALGWTPPVQTSDASREVLILAREDSEARGSTAALANDIRHLTKVEVADWGLVGYDHLQWKMAKVPGRIVRQFEPLLNSHHTRYVLNGAYNQMLNLNLDAGVHLFRNRKLIITDRLHAHVLASLMQIPHIVMDNSYGKVRSIFDDYTHQFPVANFAMSNDEAASIATDLLENKLT